MPDKNEVVLPGLDVVGRGVFLLPRQPYQLKQQLYPQHNFRHYFNADTNTTYQVPEGYGVNDSPPMPAGMALNQTHVENSIERLDKKLNLDTQISCGISAFNLDANASQTSQVRRDSDAYYASRISFIPFYSLYIADMQLDAFQADIPTPFKHINRRIYEKFFNRYGSHVVRRAWVGGKSTLTLSVLKSSDVSEEDIRAGIKASYTGFGSASVNSGLAEKKENLLNNSECTVSGKGGDSIKLAALTSLDEQSYNAWMTTIIDNPQVVELDVVGIWTLIEDEEKALALQQAYKEMVVFTPFNALFHIEDNIYFIRNRDFFTYNPESGKSQKLKPIAEKWPQLRELGFDLIDATLTGNYNNHNQPTKIDNKVLFFSGDHYCSMDVITNEFSEVKKISESFPGLHFERIDAAVHFDHDKVYFFSGSNYVRFDLTTNCVEQGYPSPISQRWQGLTFDKIDAAIYWGHGKLYFFREDQFIRYDIVNFHADSAYPQNLVGNYVEDWKIFV